MAKPGRTGAIRIYYAAGYSWNGVKQCWRHEAAFRQELMLCLLLFPLSFYATSDLAETALLIASLFIVLLMELVNSAIEAIVDRIGSEHHELSGRAKDIGSAAVLFSLLLVVVVWGLIIAKNWLL
ncbi:diacylglycerol kinase [Motiliproteus sp. MSK22-1]|uniref:diacylglycerol kinase n=1 Tax=Motiliproteus sp. MSK22-1 TaxID=1897630 RepID=UPI0009758EED|nr:diacylglycerol kinase [Motiliproteus sp. MSK22-1]OMH38292.1 diacylglycerol kinase [Motiliproteus sp. MSK22-1]